jgi:hypothetical protein
MTVFLDDFLGGAVSYELTCILMACLVDLLLNLSVFFQIAKSQLLPTHYIDHLGFHLDCKHKLFKLTDKQR